MPPGGKGARRHALQATLQGCDRAARLVEQLLTLSRLEAAEAPPLAALDLSGVVQGVVAEMAPQALQRHQQLTLDAAPICRVRGEATLLVVLVRNLVDNALRYSPPRAQVQVVVSIQGGKVTLTVEDSGPGVAEAELPRLGERFFRVLGSGQPGSGLGWSIVRRIAQVHGATVQARRSAALGGLLVSVQWPAAG
ncbi:MAG: hypothetical protein J0M00_24395 [Burkholderiales bacterium]|nr:hypothetical protein [Burkholderiales bacterium]